MPLVGCLVRLPQYIGDVTHWPPVVPYSLALLLVMGSMVVWCYRGSITYLVASCPRRGRAPEVDECFTQEVLGRSMVCTITVSRAAACIQGPPIKNNLLYKNSVFQRWQHGLAPNFKTLFANIYATYSANFIERTDVVQRIQRFKLKVHFFEWTRSCALKIRE